MRKLGAKQVAGMYMCTVGVCSLAVMHNWIVRQYPSRLGSYVQDSIARTAASLAA